MGRCVMKAFDCRICELPSRILVRGVNWVGDTVMTFPASKVLRDIFPSAHIEYWAHESLAGLLRVSRIPDEIITFPSGMNRLLRPFRMSSILREKGFDLVVLFQNAFESALTSWMAGIPMRVGYPTDARGPFINVRVPLTNEIRLQHQVFYYLQIVTFLGDYFGLRPQQFGYQPDCSIILSRQLIKKAESLLLAHGRPENSVPVICLCPGSVNSEAKRWPADNFAALADLLNRELDAFVVFLGAPTESGLVESIIRGMRHGNALNLAGETDIEQSLGIMNLSSLVISNDTGSAHLAVAASARVLTIFGPTIPGATAPFGRDAEIITGASECSPCRHFSCPLPDHPCMRSITPQSVFDKASRMIESMSERNASAG